MKAELPKINLKAGFPNKVLGIPVGWKDKGKIGSEYSDYEKHGFCGIKCRIGYEDGKLFKFCPRCLIKVVKAEE